MRTRSRFIILLTTAVLLLFILYCDNAGPVPVLIVSYMRSGSSFTGDVIASYPSSFYTFEPLKWSMHKLIKNSTIELINGTTISTSGTSADLAAEFVYGWLTCNFDRLDKESVVSMTKTRSTTSFKICLKKGKTYKNETVLRTCLKILQKQCELSKIRLVKVIRVRMRTTVEILLKRVPGLKVIHLFRDQRPRLLSAEKTPYMLWYSLKQTANLACSAASDDLEMHKVMRREYPGQLETLLYENLAEDPIGTAKRLFDFLNLPLTKTSIEGIQKMTTASTEFRCNFCTQKKNSTKTAHAWRTKNSSDFKKIKLIEMECENIQRVLGYVPIKDMEQLRNMSFDLRIVTPFTADVL
ncbi:carbohydrate sulfotransferase 5-like isoform X2 [Mizuhopecten yessoensis]|uniref:carbohydrate sulfotransferase 5-like isoform X2 n=1 Tax=Mizuhopecten yessoensis TaxID=6573 RepID=UPI000B45F27F|nr:carbohydrate sulfotransferase 5-like isoform X2 [Mizuhopecten yessoensis]